jgi:uncharacterized iron-regulated protein
VLLLLWQSIGLAGQCVPPGQWLRPGSGEITRLQDILAEADHPAIVLLGEHHENTSHHQWQLSVIKALQQSGSRIAVALEMLPGVAQAGLDQWLEGAPGQQRFLELTRWKAHWQYDVQLYFPILEYAHRQRIPLYGINLSRALLQRISVDGWESVPESAREGISQPAPPSRDYLYQLAESFRRHMPPDKQQFSDEDKAGFSRFVQVQQLWDRAMADGIAAARKQHPDWLIVALMGSGHMMNGHGVPYQLAAQGLQRPVVLVPWDEHLDCGLLKEGFADAVYGATETPE